MMFDNGTLHQNLNMIMVYTQLTERNRIPTSIEKSLTGKFRYFHLVQDGGLQWRHSRVSGGIEKPFDVYVENKE